MNIFFLSTNEEIGRKFPPFSVSSPSCTYVSIPSTSNIFKFDADETRRPASARNMFGNKRLPRSYLLLRVGTVSDIFSPLNASLRWTAHVRLCRTGAGRPCRHTACWQSWLRYRSGSGRQRRSIVRQSTAAGRPRRQNSLRRKRQRAQTSRQRSRCAVDRRPAHCRQSGRLRRRKTGGKAAAAVLLATRALHLPAHPIG